MMPTHKQQMDYLREHDPMTYYEMTNDPTGVDSGSEGFIGCLIVLVLVIGMVIYGVCYRNEPPAEPYHVHQQQNPPQPWNNQ